MHDTAQEGTDLGIQADDWFAKLDPQKRVVATALRTIVHRAAPRATESMRSGSLVYEQDGVVCGIAAFKNHVSLQFFEASKSLKDPTGVLQNAGKKGRQVKCRDIGEVRRGPFCDLIRQALKYNKAHAEN